VVLGEGMDRVKDAVRALRKESVDVRWYQPWTKNFPSSGRMNPDQLSAALGRNARWLRAKIKKGYRIVDIGEDPLRAERSEFYRLERQILDETSYPSTPM
jgi:hypothetical protein